MSDTNDFTAGEIMKATAYAKAFIDLHEGRVGKADDTDDWRGCGSKLDIHFMTNVDPDSSNYNQVEAWLYRVDERTGGTDTGIEHRLV